MSSFWNERNIYHHYYESIFDNFNDIKKVKTSKKLTITDNYVENITKDNVIRELVHQIDVLQGYRHYYLKTISSLHKQYVSFCYLIILFRCIKILELRCRIVGSSILIGNDVFLEMSLTKCLVAYYLLLINNWNSFIKYSLYQGLRLNISLLIYPIKFKFTY